MSWPSAPDSLSRGNFKSVAQGLSAGYKPCDRAMFALDKPVETEYIHIAVKKHDVTGHRGHLES